MAHGKTLLVDDHTTNSDEEDESLSLSDLPIKQQETTTTIIINNNNNNNKPPSLEEDFEFGSMGGTGSLLTESELCAADDVFFQGQILPLRFSVSSENGLSCKNPSRCGSRSESMEEHCTSTSSTGFTSLSSRSSSIKSDHQSSSSSTTTSTTYYKPKLVKNNFHSHPSPKPQIVMKNSGSKSTRTHVHRIGKSTTWGLFRVGLVRTPEIELQDLKLRNKSFSSSGSSSNGGSKRFEEEKKKKKKMQRFLFESCKCSVDAIESVSSRIVVVNKSSNGGVSVNKKKSSSSTSEKREIIKGGEVKEEEEEKEKEKQGKQKALNHRRTFEWLKELSIADVPTDEA